MARPQTSRILLKISGESLGGNGANFDAEKLLFFAKEIQKVRSIGVSLGLVCGGGNIFRGKNALPIKGFSKVSADQMGMLATVINAIALKETLESLDMNATVYTSTHMPSVAEVFRAKYAKEKFDRGEVVIMAGGTGNPFFTTDTAAVLRALELETHVIAKGTDVEGIYNTNPKEDRNAKIYRNITYQTAITEKLQVMDQTAFTLAEENKMPLLVFDIMKEGNLMGIAKGIEVGTRVS